MITNIKIYMKKSTLLLSLSALFLSISIGFNSCKEKEDDTKKEEPTACSTVTYTANIKTLVDNTCVGCHGTTSPSGNISLVTYDNVKQAAMNGKLIDAINHKAAAKAMPPAPAAKLSQATLDLFDCWKTNNFKE